MNGTGIPLLVYLNSDGEEVMIWDILDDNLHDKLRKLAKNYKLLPKLTKNFQFILANNLF